MTEFSYTGEHAHVKWKHSAHEGKWYVKRTATNAKQLAEDAQRVRNEGGTKEIDGGRVIANIPVEVFMSAHKGLTHGGRYKGILGGDHDSREKMLSGFFLEDDIKIYMLNDNYRV